jgi:GNAT superfamily N-acetyltransferase
MTTPFNGYEIHQGQFADLPAILHFRAMLFNEMEIPHEALIENSKQALRDRYELEFHVGNLAHFLAYSSEGELVAAVGVLLKDDFPYYLFKPGRYGWIVDVYTLPAHRGHGLSRKLLELTVEWLRSKGVHEAKLIASGSEAKRLYTRAGFRDTWDMYLRVDGEGTYNDYLNQREARCG